MSINGKNNGWFPVVMMAGLLASSASAQDTLYRLVELRAEDGGSSRAYAINNTGQVVGWMESGDAHHSALWHVETTTDLDGTVHFSLLHPYPLFDEGYSDSYDISNANQIVGTARTNIDCDPTILITNAFILRPATLTDLATPYPGDALTNLGTLGAPCSAPDSAAVGISNFNHVVGWADLADGSTHAYITVPAGGVFYEDLDGDGVNDLATDLATLRGDSDPVSSATAVNDDGVVTGYSYTLATPAGADGPRAAYHAFLVTPADTNADGVGDLWYRDNDADKGNDLMQDLGTLGGYNSWGRDINNSNQVVGESDTDPAQTDGENLTRAFFWQNNTMIDLGGLVDAGFSSAAAINEDGVIVGWAGNEDGQRRAFIYQDGEMQDLNDLICTQTESGITFVAGITLNEARDINDDGWIVGWGDVRGSSSSGTHGFLLIPIDAADCIVAEDEDSSSSGSSSSGSGSGGVVASNAIVGTPGNLGSGSGGSDDETTTAGGTPASAALCGMGFVGLIPLMITGLGLMKYSINRRIRRRG